MTFANQDSRGAMSAREAFPRLREEPVRKGWIGITHSGARGKPRRPDAVLTRRGSG
jgi:hypothetical protein